MKLFSQYASSDLLLVGEKKVFAKLLILSLDCTSCATSAAGIGGAVKPSSAGAQRRGR